MYHRQASLFLQIKKGFTTIELLVVVTLMGIVITGAVDIFGTVSRAQKKVYANQVIQADVRQAMEIMVRDIHTGAIDYAYYVDQGIELIKNGVAQSLNELVLTDAVGQNVRFRLNATTSGIEVSRGTSVSWQPLTTDAVVVQNVRFFIVPDSNPFVPCGSGGVDCGTVPNVQPRVTIVISAQNKAIPSQPVASIYSQTTVSTRTYQR